jgi:uncharacterized phage protein (TIGR02220 family)
MFVFCLEDLMWLSSLKKHESLNVISCLEVLRLAKKEDVNLRVDLLGFNLTGLISLAKGLNLLSDAKVLSWSKVEENCYLVKPCDSGNNLGFELTDAFKENNTKCQLGLVTRTLKLNTIYKNSSIVLNPNSSIYSDVIEQPRHQPSKEKKKSTNSEFDSLIYSICSHLNFKTKSSYRHKSDTIQKLISARMSEGFTLEDFKKVIDTKTDSWLNTEFEKYLRPQTLFGNKFESYLNEKNPRAKEIKTHDYLTNLLKEG